MVADNVLNAEMAFARSLRKRKPIAPKIVVRSAATGFVTVPKTSVIARVIVALRSFVVMVPVIVLEMLHAVSLLQAAVMTVVLCAVTGRVIVEKILAPALRIVRKKPAGMGYVDARKLVQTVRVIVILARPVLRRLTSLSTLTEPITLEIGDTLRTMKLERALILQTLL